MPIRISRKASALAAAAILSMAVAPAAAEARGSRGGWGGSGWGGNGWGGNGWRRGHDRVDGGDILAGILIIGGIAAIASAASKSDRDRKARTDTRDGDYRDSPDARDTRPDTRYSGRDDRPSWQEGRGIDNAVNLCVDEVQRSAKVDSVEGANRDGDGWRVEGRVAGGRSFACAIGTDGRIRSTTIDGRAAYAGDAPDYISEPVVQEIEG